MQCNCGQSMQYLMEMPVEYAENHEVFDKYNFICRDCTHKLVPSHKDPVYYCMKCKLARCNQCFSKKMEE